MSDDFGSIEIKIDLEMHPDQEAPTTEARRIEWAYLDTAYKLVRIAAVRTIFADVREQLVEAGLPPRTDKEMLAGAGEGVDYIDLAADVDLAQGFLAYCFATIGQETARHAKNGLEMAQNDLSGFEQTVSDLLRDLGMTGE